MRMFFHEMGSMASCTDAFQLFIITNVWCYQLGGDCYNFSKSIIRYCNNRPLNTPVGRNSFLQASNVDYFLYFTEFDIFSPWFFGKRESYCSFRQGPVSRRSNPENTTGRTQWAYWRGQKKLLLERRIKSILILISAQRKVGFGCLTWHRKCLTSLSSRVFSYATSGKNFIDANDDYKQLHMTQQQQLQNSLVWRFNCKFLTGSHSWNHYEPEIAEERHQADVPTQSKLPSWNATFQLCVLLQSSYILRGLLLQKWDWKAFMWVWTDHPPKNKLFVEIQAAISITEESTGQAGGGKVRNSNVRE